MQQPCFSLMPDTYETPTFKTPLKSTHAISSQSTAYSKSLIQTQQKYKQSSLLSSPNTTVKKSSPYQALFQSPENNNHTINEVSSRYEKDLEEVQRRYEQHYQTQHDFNNLVADLEDALALERQKVANLQEQLNDAFRGAGQDKRTKLDLERENRDLREKLRGKEAFLIDFEQKARNIQDSATSVSHENDSLRREIKKLSETCNIKMREAEEKHQKELKEFAEELDELKNHLKEQDIDSEAKQRGVSRELEAKLRTLENQIREKDRIIQEYNSEVKSQKGFNMKVKMEFEEELRKQTSMLRDEEKNRYEITIKALENKVRQLENDKALVEQKIPDLNENISIKEKSAKDLKTRLEDQIRALRKEILDLQDKEAINASNMEKLMADLRGKDSEVNRANAQVHHTNAEMQRNKDVYIREVDRLAAKNDTDSAKYQEFERQYRAKMTEFEKNMRESQSEASRARLDFERLREKVAGNLSVTLAQTFNAYGVPESNNVLLY